jgi:outer membrane protein assembly factor BamB
LTPDAVARSGRFHRLFSLDVDDFVEASPLYAAGVSIDGAARDVVYVATMGNTVYAFDADTGVELWQKSLGKPVTGLDLRIVKPHNIVPKFGIAATPVIDRDTSTMYVLRWSSEGFIAGPTYRIYALDLATGAEKRPSVKVNAKATAIGANGRRVEVTFNNRVQIMRSALLLRRHGTEKTLVMTASGTAIPVNFWGARGWVLAYDLDALDEPPAAWCSAPAGMGGAGIWMGGGGPSTDESGDIYVTTGNGPYDGTTQFAESFVRLHYATGELTRVGSFTPFVDSERDSRHRDQDLGASAPVILPGGAIVGGGKDGILYNVNRADMGGRDTSKLLQPPFVASYTPAPGTDPVKDPDIISSHDPVYQGPADGGKIHHIHGAPVYWNGRLFLWGENATMRAFTYESGRLTPAAEGNIIPSKDVGGIGGMPGGILSISANGQTEGSGIVWAQYAISGDPSMELAAGALRAFDASSFPGGQLVELWNSEASPGDALGNVSKFVPPVVANGRVYVATYDKRVQVYGLH